MGRIVAIGGQEHTSIFRYIKEMTHKDNPNFLFIATPSTDNTEYYARISMQVGDLGCETRPLYLFRRKYTKAQLDSIFAWADIIYVCGGDTYKCVETWLKFGIDKYMSRVFVEDSAILCGSSAGGICWFDRGFSDSSRTPEYPPHGWVNGIGLLPGTFCPHFSSRSDSYRTALSVSGDRGLGLDNDTAYVYDNGRVSFIRAEADRSIVVFDGKGETTPVIEELND